MSRPDYMAALERMEAQAWAEYLAECRRLDQPAPRPGEPRPEFERDDPGHPLGHGMPLGRTLRADGQTHREAWASVVRADPCSFCGRPRGGTVDHIEPRSLPARGLGGAHCWANFAGACANCNVKKGQRSLLDYMLARCTLRERQRARRRRAAPVELLAA